MAKKKTVQELEAENEALKSRDKSRAVTTTINLLIPWAEASFIVYQICQAFVHSVTALASHSTSADIAVKLAGSLSVSQGISYALAAIFGGGGISYGLAQNKLRKKTVAHLQGRVHQNELETDPGRTSSHLTPEGDTRPEDLP